MFRNTKRDYNSLDDDKEFEEMLSTFKEALEAKKASAFTDPDPIIPTAGLQVWIDGAWEPAAIGVWRSWTGHRALWGQMHHGPVYAMNTVDDTVPWNGPRACKCSTCQSHVARDSHLN